MPYTRKTAVRNRRAATSARHSSGEKKYSGGKWKVASSGLEYIQGWRMGKKSGFVVVTAFLAKNSIERTSENSGRKLISYAAIVENKTTMTKSNYPAWYCKENGCLYITSLSVMIDTKKDFMYVIRKK